jgi:hypothetical protein
MDSDNNIEIRPTRRLLRIQIFTICALLSVVLALCAVLIIGHVKGEYQKRDDRYAALAIKTDRNAKETVIRHNKAMSAAAIKFEKETKRAVKHQKNHDTAVLRRVVRRMKVRARREAEAARAAGYSSGNSAGFNTGHSVGVDDGVKKASDELTCSDDLDVPLPFCTGF